MSRAAVLGAGSWGTAFAATMADAGSDVVMWGRRQEVVDQVNAGMNSTYLPGIHLPGGVRATPDPVEALDGADIVVLAVPSQTLRANLVGWRPLLPQGAAVVSLMKGVELGTTKRMSEVIADVGEVAAERIVVVSGPNLAREIAERHPAASVVACVREATAERVAAACVTPWFRPYTNDDVIGIELGGAVKNVVALAVGMAAGMGMGDNSKASLITRGLAETARLGAALGADPATFMGLAGVGDLIATCMSPLSRNRTFGELLGGGRSVTDVTAATSQTAEGVKSCESIHELAVDHGVDMPIVGAVVAVVRGQVTPQQMVDELMTRSLKSEGD